MARGAVLTLEQAWRLARAWYSDRLRPDWRRKTIEDTAATFAELELTSYFWDPRPRT
jgi:hypothetical protein